MPRLGHHVEQGEAPFTLDGSTRLFGPVGQAGLAWLLADKGGEPQAPMLREMAAAGRALTPQAVFGAVDGVAPFRRRMAGFFGAWDLILTPAAAALPWPAAQVAPPVIDGQPVGPRGHAPVHQLRQPGRPARHRAALPSLRQAGLPIGFQLVGPFGCGRRPLRLGGRVGSRPALGRPLA